jgi:hypothetical protein
MAPKSASSPIQERLRTLPAREKRHALTDDDKILIAYLAGRQYPEGRIAQAVPCGAARVRTYLKALRQDPVSLLELPVLARVGQSSWRCEMCGQTAALTTLTKARRHVLLHVFPGEIVGKIRFTGLENPV